MKVYLFGTTPWVCKLWTKIFSQRIQPFTPSRSTICCKRLLCRRRGYKCRQCRKSHTVDTCSSKGGLPVHKLVSNNHAVLQSLPPSDCTSEAKTKDLTFKDTLERALGIQWRIKEDSFRFNNTLKDQSATQRGILSTVASLYDPLGFLESYVLNGKRILQEMCNQGTGWDETLPERLKPRRVGNVISPTYRK